MKQSKSERYLVISSVIASVICLTICYMAYSVSVKFEHTIDKINKEDFRVSFSSHPYNLEYSKIKPLSSTDKTQGDAIIISRDGSILTNLHATFTSPGQSVTYKLYIINYGAYNAYLESVTFLENSNGKFKTCVTSTITEKSTKACEGVNIKIKIGDKWYTKSEINLKEELLKGNNKEVLVTIYYDSLATMTDIPLKVYFGNIKIVYWLFLKK